MELVQRVFLLLVIAMVSVACGGSNQKASDGSSGLQTRLVLKDKFDQQTARFTSGEEIRFELVLQNTQASSRTLNFNTGQQYDIYITSFNGSEVWRWSTGRGFTQSLTQVSVPANGSVTVNESWINTLSVGSYTALGSMLDQSPVARFNFQVQ